MGYELALTSGNWVSDESGKLHLWTPLSTSAETLKLLRGDLTDEALSAIAGQWMVVDRRADKLVVASDRVRSHPLLYAWDGRKWIITDDVELFRTRNLWHLNRADAQLFAHMAFVLADRTLLDGVYSLQAGTKVTLEENGERRVSPYFTYAFDPEPITDEGEYHALFEEALTTSLQRVLDQAGSRQLVVPLSGGLDSRLMAALLKKLGAANILTFTYGKENSPESGISKAVADDLGLPWIYVPMPVEEVQQAWHSEEGHRFVAQTWKGTSLPHVQDFFALTQMREQELVAPDAVFLPGHTIVGNMHDEQILEHRPSGQELNLILASHHASQQGRARSVCANPLWLESVRAVASQVGLGHANRDLQAYLEWFNLIERQAKYINNSMCGYEFFGYSWALPMLDLPMWQAWLAGSEALTATRAWYARFTADIYYQITGKEMGLFAPRSTQMNASLKARLLAGMRLVGADKALSKYRSIRTMLNHPMSFEAFASTDKVHQLGSYLAGATQMGLWADEFLTGRWGDVLPRS